MARPEKKMLRKRIVNAYLSSVISISLVLLLTGVAALLVLNAHGVTATVRRRLGFDIDASCGQLRRKYQRGQTGEEGATQ